MEKDEPAFTFRAVQIFVAVVDAQSVTRAAHRLGLSPSSVSQQLAGLETALGAKLIERSARLFQLTRAGATFLTSAKSLLDGVSDAKARLMTVDQAPPLALRLASIEELDATVTPAWLLGLTQQFPNLSLSLTSGASHENHDALASRAVDLIMAVDTVPQVDWVAQYPILRDPFVLLVSPKLADADLETIIAQPFVGYASDLLIGRQIDAQLRRTGVTPQRGFTFTTNQALFAMTAELDGWALTTALAYLGTPFPSERLIARALPIPQFSRRLALHARAGALGPLPQVIADALRDAIRSRLGPLCQDRLPFLGDRFSVLPDESEKLN